MEIVFENQVPRLGRIPRAVILRAAARAQKLFGSRVAGAAASVVFVSAAASRKLNREYRSKDAPTNVLSFASLDRAEIGDIIIAPSVAREEARQMGRTFDEHVAYLFVHGLLHFLGFAHSSPTEERRMEAASEKILNTK